MNKNLLVCVSMQQWAGVNAKNGFGMYSKQLHGKQLSSYKLQGWLFSAILNFCKASWTCPVKELVKRNIFGTASWSAEACINKAIKLLLRISWSCCTELH